MIRFDKFKVADVSGLRSYLDKVENCELSLANLYGWGTAMDMETAKLDGFVCVRYWQNGSPWFYMPMPLQDWSHLDVVLRKLMDDTHNLGFAFRMNRVVEKDKDRLAFLMGDSLHVTYDRDACDYVYQREKLVTLSGKNLQSKRNHAHEFRGLYPDYEYRDMSPDQFPSCLALSRKWNLVDEYRALQNMMSEWEELQCRGGAIYVKGRLVAFTIGNPINPTTFDVCMEKADTDYKGAYAVINQEFASRLPLQYVWINREEDCGVAGLRKAKMSYHPDHLIDKYQITDDWTPSNLTARLSETRKLWEDTFHDDDEWMNGYFSAIYRDEWNVVYCVENHVVGALQTIPYILNLHGMTVKAAYVSGVSVRKDLQRQGIGKALMQKAYHRMRAMGVEMAVLVPASPSLVGWYGGVGYAVSPEVPLPDKAVCGMDTGEFSDWQRCHIMVRII